VTTFVHYATQSRPLNRSPSIPTNTSNGCGSKVTRLLSHDFRPCHNLRRLVSGFPPRWPRFDPRLGHVGFVLNEVALGQVFSEYFGFPCQFSFHHLLHIHLSSGAGILGQLMADVTTELMSHLTPRNLKKLLMLHIQKAPVRFSGLKLSVPANE
jgi:hypothetical protein